MAASDVPASSSTFNPAGTLTEILSWELLELELVLATGLSVSSLPMWKSSSLWASSLPWATMTGMRPWTSGAVCSPRQFCSVQTKFSTFRPWRQRLCKMLLCATCTSHHCSWNITSSLWHSQGRTGSRRCCCCWNSLAHTSGRSPPTGSCPAGDRAPCGEGAGDTRGPWGLFSSKRMGAARVWLLVSSDSSGEMTANSR